MSNSEDYDYEDAPVHTKPNRMPMIVGGVGVVAVLVIGFVLATSGGIEKAKKVMGEARSGFNFEQRYTGRINAGYKEVANGAEYGRIVIESYFLQAEIPRERIDEIKRKFESEGYSVMMSGVKGTDVSLNMNQSCWRLIVQVKMPKEGAEEARFVCGRICGVIHDQWGVVERVFVSIESE